MQFFRHDCAGSEFFAARFQIQPIVDSTPRELFQGVVLERRVMLGCSLGALTALLGPISRHCSGQENQNRLSQSTDEAALELETLISRLRPEARRLIASESPDEEKYIELAIQELAKVTRLETNGFRPSKSKTWEMDFQAYVPPLLLYKIRMSPNSIIELHDHRHHNGAFSVREGTVRIRSFDHFQEERDQRLDVAAGEVPGLEEEFFIQENGDSTLKVGQSVGLTRTRDNMHQIEAGPDGCLLYDLFTNFKLDAQSFEIKWDGKYFDPARKLCKVLWLPPDHPHE